MDHPTWAPWLAPPPLQPGQPQATLGSVPAVGAQGNAGLPAGSTSTAALAALTAAPAAGHRAGGAEARPSSAPCTAGPGTDSLPRAPGTANPSLQSLSSSAQTGRRALHAAHTPQEVLCWLSVHTDQGKRGKTKKCRQGLSLQSCLMELGAHLPSNSTRAFLVCN